jgi:superfamily I DNA/RNA helicase
MTTEKNDIANSTPVQNQNTMSASANTITSESAARLLKMIRKARSLLIQQASVHSHQEGSQFSSIPASSARSKSMLSIPSATVLNSITSNQTTSQRQKIKYDNAQLNVIKTDAKYCLIEGGAGTGKTTVLAARAIHLLGKQTENTPQVVVMTGNEAVAQSVKQYINDNMSKKVPPGKLSIGTFHSIATEMFKPVAERNNRSTDFEIWDAQRVTTELRDHIITKEALDKFKEDNYPEKEWSDADQTAFHKAVSSSFYADLQKAQHNTQKPSDVFERTDENGKSINPFKTLYQAYQNHKKAKNAFDYNDIITYTTQFVEEDYEKYKNSAVLVDEYQDLDPLQSKLLKSLMKCEGNTLFAVGNNKQCIYDFRGATESTMQNFENDYGDAKRMTLQHNYRLTEHNLNAANMVLGNKHDLVTLSSENQNKKLGNKVKTAVYKDNEAERAAIVEQVKGLAEKNHKLNDMAILVRNNTQVEAFKTAFKTAGIPYQSDQEAGKSDAVNIMTMHAARGREFDTVFSADWTKDRFPIFKGKNNINGQRLAEDARLASMTISRAKKNIYLSSGGSPSPFINRLPKDCVENMNNWAFLKPQPTKLQAFNNSKNSLNPQQRVAVEAKDDQILVLAGAGTGKTTVLTTRVASLVQDKKVDPSELVVMTFTKKAASEMKERLGGMLDDSQIKKLTIGTYHSVGAQILRPYAAKFNLNPDFKTQEETGKQGANIVSYDNLIKYPTQLLTTDNEAMKQFNNKFKHILVDEYQDTSGNEKEFVKALKGEKATIFAVGDDDQCIYGFKGADVKNILNFNRDFPNTKTIKLEENYRSNEHILAATNALIKNNHPSDNTGKTLYTNTKKQTDEKVKIISAAGADQEMKAIKDEVSRLTKGSTQFKDIAILVRNNNQVNAFKQAFEQNAKSMNILTLHGAKGLEFDTVFLPHWNKGGFPRNAGDNEERRLAHVGITRAKKNLYVSHTGEPSQFLTELQAAAPKHIDHRDADGAPINRTTRPICTMRPASRHQVQMSPKGLALQESMKKYIAEKNAEKLQQPKAAAQTASVQKFFNPYTQKPQQTSTAQKRSLDDANTIQNPNDQKRQRLDTPNKSNQTGLALQESIRKHIATKNAESNQAQAASVQNFVNPYAKKSTPQTVSRSNSPMNSSPEIRPLVSITVNQKTFEGTVNDNGGANVRDGGSTSNFVSGVTRGGKLCDGLVALRTQAAQAQDIRSDDDSMHTQPTTSEIDPNSSISNLPIDNLVGFEVELRSHYQIRHNEFFNATTRPDRNNAGRAD